MPATADEGKNGGHACALLTCTCIRIETRVLRIASIDSQQRPSSATPASSSAVNDENFLIAKIGDSESLRVALHAAQRLARTTSLDRALQIRIQESPAVQALPAYLTIFDVGGVGIFRILFSTRRVVAAKHAAYAPGFLRQHFLKWDTVFFDPLVYSEWSAFRFPNARSDKAISLHQEGNMAKKAKKAKKAKSAVKKTAKKTRKVSKKKK